MRKPHDAHPAFVEISRQLTPDEAKIVTLFEHNTNFPVIKIEKLHKIERDGQMRDVRSWVYRHFSLLGYKAGCQFPEATPRYLDNICRLGLANIPSGGLGSDVSTMTPDAHIPLYDHPEFLKIFEQSTPPDKPVSSNKVLRVTDLGKQFVRACLTDDIHMRQPRVNK
jgi:hypothetical protein